MIVGFHFHQNIHRLADRAVAAGHGIGEKSIGRRALDGRRIIPVGRKHAGGILGVGRANHGKQR
jgi:hypothetical protein